MMNLAADAEIAKEKYIPVDYDICASLYQSNSIFGMMHSAYASKLEPVSVILSSTPLRCSS